MLSRVKSWSDHLFTNNRLIRTESPTAYIALTAIGFVNIEVYDDIKIINYIIIVNI